jgi:hypothetical protein
VDRPLEGALLERGIEALEELLVHGMDLVDEENVAAAEPREEGSHLLRVLEGASEDDLDPDSHLLGHGAGERRLP